MANTRLTLAATKRTLTGKKVRTLRREKKIPANVFGKKTSSLSLTLEAGEFEKIFRKAGSTSLIDLAVSGEKESRPVLIAHIQKHPVSDNVLHVDLHEVDLTEKVTASIPVKIMGVSLAVKDKGAVLITVLSEVKVEALPTDLPDHIDVDVSALSEIGQSILVKDLPIDRKRIHILDSEQETVITAQEPKQEVEEAPAPVAPAEGEAAVEAGAQPAEGESREAGSSTKPGQKPEEKKEQGEKKQAEEAGKKK